VTDPVPSRPAAFLDRDGTIVQDTGYLRDPRTVALIPGAAGALRRLNDARVPVVVVTNQSGLARGLITAADYDAVRARMEALLVAEGARVEATYICPHAPDDACDCRKPAPLLFRRAAAEHSLDLGRSAYIGDRWRDAAPAATLGGFGMLVVRPTTPAEDLARAEADGIATVRSLDEAVDRFLATLPAKTAGP
jgi:D-glycero-D-manno-heptose 1,7-bisphosphate phosphatase